MSGVHALLLRRGLLGLFGRPGALRAGAAGPFGSVRPTWDSAGSVDVPAWPCTGWGLPGRRVTTPPVRSYRTVSPLPATGERSSPPLRRLFSVALSRGFPRVGFPDHPALRCPDFPRTGFLSGPRLSSQLLESRSGAAFGLL